ncbi:MAG: hypothetical protein OXI44_08310 [Bacteroidota bacterium]|nr:hypothetical protein [Bacteroidota bacterium]
MRSIIQPVFVQFTDMMNRLHRYFLILDGSPEQFSVPVGSGLRIPGREFEP